VTNQDVIHDFPNRRIEPFDGMAVTAQAWKEAHDYHRRQQQLHALLNHGAGIVTGLEVIASDPPDSSVYILPGIAVDTQGQIIVLPEPTAYDLGSSQGLLYLLLTYEESHPIADREREDEILYVHAQFGVEARSSLPHTACVELARIRRRSREAPIMVASDPAHPAANEIDLRFRQQIGAPPRAVATIAMCDMSGVSGARHERGISYLARALRNTGQQVWVDHDAVLGPDLGSYTLVYLVGQAAFQLGEDEIMALLGYLQDGGTLVVESCRRGTTTGAPPADASFSDLLASFGVKLEEVPRDHPLLTEPYLFATPPPGYETGGSPKVLVDNGVIFSTHDYGCLWQGERRDGTASREEIRTALEWGSNIVAYAMKRRAS
jgi:hypothetical protein